MIHKQKIFQVKRNKIFHSAILLSGNRARDFRYVIDQMHKASIVQMNVCSLRCIQIRKKIILLNLRALDNNTLMLQYKNASCSVFKCHKTLCTIKITKPYRNDPIFTNSSPLARINNLIA